ncbi:hypothetical protein [uncultured Xanthomonas sp.]|uniref:hypothetical protein n=1 Tax=uncultured Xanthomonas sp. TaxID=152831 RepID=UPI0025D183AB|nr:hypothetical protein [uncultured Xanthomonas sp.]
MRSPRCGNSRVVVACGVGCFSGIFDLGGLVNAGTILSLLLCAALFGHLARRAAQHRLAHACLYLVACAAQATVVAALSPPEPTVLLILEWLQLLASTGFGLLVGRLFQPVADQRRLQ